MDLVRLGCWSVWVSHMCIWNSRVFLELRVSFSQVYGLVIGFFSWWSECVYYVSRSVMICYTRREGSVRVSFTVCVDK